MRGIFLTFFFIMKLLTSIAYPMSPQKGGAGKINIPKDQPGYKAIEAGKLLPGQAGGFLERDIIKAYFFKLGPIADRIPEISSSSHLKYFLKGDNLKAADSFADELISEVRKVNPRAEQEIRKAVETKNLFKIKDSLQNYGKVMYDYLNSRYSISNFVSTNKDNLKKIRLKISSRNLKADGEEEIDGEIFALIKEMAKSAKPTGATNFPPQNLHQGTRPGSDDKMFRWVAVAVDVALVVHTAAAVTNYVAIVIALEKVIAKDFQETPDFELNNEKIIERLGRGGAIYDGYR